MSNIVLKPVNHEGFAIVNIELPNQSCEPSDLIGLDLPDGLNHQEGIVFSGRAPVWLFGCLVHQAHIFKWVGTFDPRLGGAVVVETHGGNVQVGQVVPVPKSV